MAEARWHPDYIAFLKSLKGKALSDFDVRPEPHPAGFRRSYYRAYLNDEIIVGAESRQEVISELNKLLERARLLPPTEPAAKHFPIKEFKEVEEPGNPGTDNNKALYFGQKEKLAVSLLSAGREIRRNGVVPLAEVRAIAEKYGLTESNLTEWLRQQPWCVMTPGGALCHLG